MLDLKSYDKIDPTKSMVTVIPEHLENPIATKNGIHVADEKLLLTYLVDAAE